MLTWVLGAALAVPACAPNRADDPAPSELVARRGALQQRVLLTGELHAVEAADIIVPRTPTWQMPIRWMEADGAVVEQGQKVLELDNTQFTGELDQKRLAEAAAHGELLNKQADLAVQLVNLELQLERARIALERARIEASVPAELLKRREHQELLLALARAEVAHDKALADVGTTKRVAEAEIEEIEVKLRRARGEVRVAERAIRDLALVAPRSGILVVSENRGEGRKFQVGDNVHVGLAVMRIPDLSSMKVVAQLSDVDDRKIAPGMRVECSLDSYPDRTYGGAVRQILPIAREQGRNSLRRAFRVTVGLDESDPERMRPGMSVKVEVLPAPRDQVLLAPRAALELEHGKPRALLAGGSFAEVVLGPCNALECVIERGLEEGDRLRRRG